MNEAARESGPFLYYGFFVIPALGLGRIDVSGCHDER